MLGLHEMLLQMSARCRQQRGVTNPAKSRLLR